MATGNLLLGQASGAVGSLVFARANGKQVTKARQEAVRYSNTLAQAIQRICISTAGQAYRHMQEVCCKSFQGIKQGKATHDEFMKRNVRMLRQIIRQADAQNLTYSDLRYFTPVGNDTLLPGAYIVSSGSLPAIITNIDSADPTHARLAGVGTTYQDLITFYGLQRGDILTFVFMQPDSSGIVRARSARVVLDPRSPMGDMVSLDVPFIAADNKVNFPNPGNSGEFTFLVNDSGDIIYSLVNSDVPLIAAGVFASRRSAAGSWLHSDCQLSLYNDSDILDKFTLQQAIDVANGAPIAAISPDYLNNAGVSRLPVSNTSDYKLLEYISFASGQYINTGVVPADRYVGFKVDYQVESLISSDSGICGSNVRDNFDNLQAGVYHSQWRLKVSNQATFAGYYDANRHTLNVNLQQGTWLDNNSKIINSQLVIPSSNVRPILIGSIDYSGVPGAPDHTFFLIGKIYSFDIYDGNRIINEFRPCKRISDDTVGMLDIISNIFYENAGSGSITPGPVVNS